MIPNYVSPSLADLAVEAIVAAISTDPRAFAAFDDGKWLALISRLIEEGHLNPSYACMVTAERQKAAWRN